MYRLSQIILIVLLLFAGAVYYTLGSNNFFHDAFSGFATLISAWVVIAVYLFQKQDEKTKSARILLMEIRNAEKSLEEIKKELTTNNAVSDAVFTLPVNSWISYRHLFVKDFDPDELELINNFYNYCFLTESAVQRFKQVVNKAGDEKIKLYQQKLAELLYELKSEPDQKKYKERYEEYKQKIVDGFNNEVKYFSPDLEIYKVKMYLPNIRYVTTSSCGKKLKQLARE